MKIFEKRSVAAIVMVLAIVAGILLLQRKGVPQYADTYR